MVSYFTKLGYMCKYEGLNLYCSGQWSRTVQFDCASVHLESLNPYCSGRWSRTARTIVMNTVDEFVLILVVVDNGLVLIKIYWVGLMLI